MILHLFRRQPSAAATLLYDRIVAQARSPGFYRDYGVPDTLDGRFEMVVLHLFLVMRRLESAGNDAGALGQQVFDLFCRDMDENLREIGTSDLKVPKEMRRLGEAYYGRARAYEGALQDRNRWREVLARNVVGRDEPAATQRLAEYVTVAAERLASQKVIDFERGIISFPQT
jgi:cytochrome b pre-mRNA-processing protein 3